MYVSNPLVLDSFTSSPRQIVVTAKTPGVSSLVLWDEAGQSTTYLVFSDLDVASLQTEIRQALPNENITVEAQQDRVSLSGTVLSDASADAAVKLAGLYTKNCGQFCGGESSRTPAGEAKGPDRRDRPVEDGTVWH